MLSPFELGKSVQRVVGDPIFVVPRPDHPLLLSGPDLLLGGQGKLTAIFLVGQTIRPSKLRARIVASRLALPLEARIVAAFTPEAGTLPNDLPFHFDEILEGRDLAKSVARFAVSDKRTKVDLKALSNVKRVHSIAYTTALQIALLRKQHHLEVRHASEVVSELKAGANVSLRSERNKNIQETTVLGSRVSALPSKGDLLGRLNTVWHSGLNDRYTLDAGVPHESLNSLPSILLTEHWPTNKTDPEKPLRAGAFGGWIFAQSTTSNDIRLLVERAQSITRKRIHERSQSTY